MSEQSIGVDSSVRDDRDYHEYLSRIQSRFETLQAHGLANAGLFATDAEGLFDAFLDGMSMADRQHYTCNSCRRFVDRFGGIVLIDVDGNPHSPFWAPDDAPAELRGAVAAVLWKVLRAKVTGVFLCSEPVWGTPITGEWHHMAFVPATALVFNKAAMTAFQAAAEKKEDFKNVMTALTEFTLPQIQQAITLLETEALYRSEKCLGVAKWLKLMHEIRDIKNQTVRHNKTWVEIAKAPAGFCHPRASMIGTLLVDIAAGMDFADVSRRFAVKMSPTQYQRAQTAPSQGAVAAAEKLFAEMKLQPSLSRRYARLEEIQAIWSPKVVFPKPGASVGVFSHLSTKTKSEPVTNALNIPAVTMTWDKFQKTILPNAESIEVVIPDSSNRLMAMVTAADPASPPILQWDSEEQRNPVSWYYADGIDAEVKRRVMSAGGQYENVDIRASLMWNNRNDLDLHVITPQNERIYYASKHSRCGGWLDVDMNVRGETTTPVENTRWAAGVAPNGIYRVAVANYRFHEYDHLPTLFRIELEVNGDVFHYDGVVHNATAATPSVTACSFNYGRNVKVDIHTLGAHWRTATVGVNEWGMTSRKYAAVSAISESPNMWGAKPLPQHGRHIFFLLEGCRDARTGVGRGFFTETLKSELRPVRSVLEAYNASATIAEPENATACGIGMSNQSPWNLLVRVTTSGQQVHYNLDRWD